MANLVRHLQEEYQTESVIAHGFHHGGAMSVWLAHRHPQLVAGFWASSATLFAEKDHHMFLTNVAENIQVIGGDQCYRQTEEAFEQMERYYATGNYRELEQAFNLCSNFTGGDDLEAFAFFYTYAVSLGHLIRFTHRTGVEGLCHYYGFNEDPMRGLASFLGVMLPECIEIDGSETLESVKSIAWDNPTFVRDQRQMMYQYCREFGWYTSSSGANHPFGTRFPLEVFQQHCHTIFGPM